MGDKRIIEKYYEELTKNLQKYEPLRDLDLFVLDNSIRESTVGQLRGHTSADKWRILDEVRMCGFSDVIVASFSDHVTVDEDYLQELVLNGIDKSGLYAFSDITTGIKNGILDTKNLPKGLTVLKRRGLHNVILELDLGDSVQDFRKFTIDDMCNLLLKLVTWCHDNLHEKSKELINFRDMPEAMRDNPGRVFKVVTFLARLPPRLSLFGILFEDPKGECMPEEFATWAKYIREIMNVNGWSGHLLVHVHEKFCLGDFAVLEALLNGANGIWAGVSREGAQVGHAASIVTLINLIRLGNKTVLQRYNCTYLRTAATNVTRITTGHDPPDSHPIYGARALDFVLNLEKDDFHLADFFGVNAPVRISSVCSVEMIKQRLEDMFGPNKQFTIELASKMKKQMLQDTRGYRKEEYMSKCGLASLFRRAGGILTKQMREELARDVLLTPQAEKLLRKVRKRWDIAIEDSGDKLSKNALPYNVFYKHFMDLFFPCFRCLESRRVLSALDSDGNGTITWQEIQILLTWTLYEYPETGSVDDVMETIFWVGLKDVDERAVFKYPQSGKSDSEKENKLPYIVQTNITHKSRNVPKKQQMKLPKTSFLPNIRT